MLKKDPDQGVHGTWLKAREAATRGHCGCGIDVNYCIRRRSSCKFFMLGHSSQRKWKMPRASS